jgi:hypothetical protein
MKPFNIIFFIIVFLFCVINNVKSQTYTQGNKRSVTQSTNNENANCNFSAEREALYKLFIQRYKEVIDFVQQDWKDKNRGAVDAALAPEQIAVIDWYKAESEKIANKEIQCNENKRNQSTNSTGASSPSRSGGNATSGGGNTPNNQKQGTVDNRRVTAVTNNPKTLGYHGTVDYSRVNANRAEIAERQKKARENEIKRKEEIVAPIVDNINKNTVQVANEITTIDMGKEKFQRVDSYGNLAKDHRAVSSPQNKAAYRTPSEQEELAAEFIFIGTYQNEPVYRNKEIIVYNGNNYLLSEYNYSKDISDRLVISQVIQKMSQNTKEQGNINADGKDGYSYSTNNQGYVIKIDNKYNLQPEQEKKIQQELKNETIPGTYYIVEDDKGKIWKYDEYKKANVKAIELDLDQIRTGVFVSPKQTPQNSSLEDNYQKSGINEHDYESVKKAIEENGKMEVHKVVTITVSSPASPASENNPGNNVIDNIPEQKHKPVQPNNPATGDAPQTPPGASPSSVKTAGQPDNEEG